MQTSKWQLKPHVHVGRVAEEALVLTWLGQRILLKTPVASEMPRVLEFLREPRSIDDLHRHLDRKWTTEVLARLIEGLANFKLIFAVDDRPARREHAGHPWLPFFQLFSNSEAEWTRAIEKIEALRVGLCSRMTAPDDFLAEFRVDRIPLKDSQAEKAHDLRLLVLSSSDFDTLEDLSREGYATTSLTLPVLLDPHGAIVGPLSGGPGRACLSCLSRRLRSGGDEAEVPTSLPEALDDVAIAWPPTYWRKLDGILREEIVKWASGLVYSPLERGAFVLDFLNHRGDHEEVFPVPGCSCSAGF